MDPDDGYISKISPEVFRSIMNPTNQQNKVSLLKRFHDKHHVIENAELPATYHSFTDSYELDHTPIGGQTTTSERPYHIAVQDTRQHLTEVPQIQAPTLDNSQYYQLPVKNGSYDIFFGDYTDSTYKILPQMIAKVNPVTAYTQNAVDENAVTLSYTPLKSQTSGTIGDPDNTFLTDLLQKLKSTTQRQSQLSTNSDNVDVDYSIISLFKIVNDFKRAKEMVGSSANQQFHIPTGAKNSMHYNTSNGKSLKGMNK